MKNLRPTFLLLAILLCCLALPIMSFAEPLLPEDVGSFFFWELIGTYAGAVAVVVFIVQLLKLPIDRIWHIPTQYVVYVVSLAVLLLAQAFIPSLGGLTWQNGILCAFNAILVALLAMSTYSIAIERPETSKLINNSRRYICITKLP